MPFLRGHFIVAVRLLTNVAASARVSPVSGSTSSAASVSGIEADAISDALTSATGFTRGGSTPEFILADCKVTILPWPGSDIRE